MWFHCPQSVTAVLVTCCERSLPDFICLTRIPLLGLDLGTARNDCHSKRGEPDVQIGQATHSGTHR